jgi:putative Mn2+ efflux pump MntP
MTPGSIAVIAVGMSLDSGIACIGRGAAERRPQLRNAVATGLVFGLVEAATPVIGWAAGLAARSYVVSLDHWIAFVLLGLVGLHMVRHGHRAQHDVVAPPPPQFTLMALLATAIGTSVDAMAVGVSLAILQVDILAVALAVGATTCAFSVGGLMIGRFVGRAFGGWAEIAGGLALIALGSVILLEHLFG